MGKRRRKSIEPRGSSRSKSARASRAEVSATGETPSAPRFEDQLTVFWMLSTVFALAAIVLGLTSLAYVEFFAPAEARPRATAVHEYARLATAVVSLLLFILTPIVLWLRQVPPPKAITAFVVLTATVGLGWALFGDPPDRNPSSRTDEVRSDPAELRSDLP